MDAQIFHVITTWIKNYQLQLRPRNIALYKLNTSLMTIPFALEEIIYFSLSRPAGVSNTNWLIIIEIETPIYKLTILGKGARISLEVCKRNPNHSYVITNDADYDFHKKYIPINNYDEIKSLLTNLFIDDSGKIDLYSLFDQFFKPC